MVDRLISRFTRRPIATLSPLQSLSPGGLSLEAATIVLVGLLLFAGIVWKEVGDVFLGLVGAAVLVALSVKPTVQTFSSSFPRSVDVELVTALFAGVSTRFVVDVLGPGELDDEDTPIGPRWLFGLGLPVGGIVALAAVGATGPALFASVGGAVSVVLDGLGDLGEPVEKAAVTLLFGILLVASVRLVL